MFSMMPAEEDNIYAWMADKFWKIVSLHDTFPGEIWRLWEIKTKVWTKLS
jgi:hypothetical protein